MDDANTNNNESGHGYHQFLSLNSVFGVSQLVSSLVKYPKLAKHCHLLDIWLLKGLLRIEKCRNSATQGPWAVSNSAAQHNSLENIEVML